MFFWDEDAERVKQTHEMMMGMVSKTDTKTRILNGILDRLNELDERISFINNDLLDFIHKTDGSIDNKNKTNDKKKKTNTSKKIKKNEAKLTDIKNTISVD